jgi:hypothetical protein
MILYYEKNISAGIRYYEKKQNQDNARFAGSAVPLCLTLLQGETDETRGAPFAELGALCGAGDPRTGQRWAVDAPRPPSPSACAS